MNREGPRASLFLRLEAPFSAFRWLQAGVFRATAPVMPPSTAWGLVLNLAWIESRGALDQPVTPIRPDAPSLDISVGLLREGSRCSIYQQLHTYPVGSSGKELQARAHGQKYWIAPARRELLVDLVCAVGVRGPIEIVERVVAGLNGQLQTPRYGLPFAGDNQFLFNRIDVLPADVQARWFIPVPKGEIRPGSARLTTQIDRTEATRTQAPLFAPTEVACLCPDQAWVAVGPTAAA